MKNRTSIFRPVALTFLMALPFGFGVGFLAAGVHEGWQEYKREVLAVNSWGEYHRHSLVFLSDGTPVVRDNKSVGYGRWQDVYTRMDGTPLTHEERQDVMQQQRLRAYGNHRRHPFDREPFDGLLSNSNRRRGFQDPENRSIHWTWDVVRNVPTGRVLVGRYGSSYGSPISFITPEGFVPELSESSEGFLSLDDIRHDDEMTAFRSDGKLIAINLAEKTITTIAEVAPHRYAWSMFRQNDETGWRFAVRSRTGLQIYSSGGEKLFEVPAESTAYGPAEQLYTPTDGQFILTETESRDEEQLPGGGTTSRTTMAVSWLDETGQVTRTMKFGHEYRRERPPTEYPIVNAIDQFMELAGPGLMCPEPAVMCGAVFVIAPWISLHMFPERPASEAIQEILEEIPYGIPVSALVALCCAIACWRRQTRYGAEWTKTWVVFVFLFGLPAWIAWRVHRRWPPLDLAGAPETEFIGPEPNGLEIR
jgi:hypothetical protein